MFPTVSGLGADAPDVLATARELLTSYVPADGSAELIEQIRVLEELRALVSATQASVTAAFVVTRKEEQVAAGLPKRRVGLGLGQEIGLAKRESPHKASLYAGWATVVTTELPCTFAALRSGQTSQWRAQLLAKETGWLSREDRATVDAQLGPRLGALGDRDVVVEARKLAYTLDPRGLVNRFARATAHRRVGLRAEEEGMSRLTAILPATQGIATIAALNLAAAQARAAGDERSRGQVMADTLVERVTGQTRADGVPLMVDVIITDQAFVNDGPRSDDPATVSGYGPIPANVARDLITRTAIGSTAATPSSAPAASTTPPDGAIKPASAVDRRAADDETLVRLRRLFTDPAGRLVSMETKTRFFTPAQAEFVRLRDQRCTTAYCGAPIKQIDHLLPWHDGGPSSLINAGGKCESCNQAKEAPGWGISPQEDGTVRITTPTGHDSTTFTPAQAPGRTHPETSPPPDVTLSLGAPPGARSKTRGRRTRSRHTRAPIV